MSESQTPGSGGVSPDLPDAVVRDHAHRRRRLSTVWIIPIVAALVGLSLAYRAWQERGVEVTVSFETGSGITPGKTTVRFRDVEVGTVTDIAIGGDLSEVVTTLSLHAAARPYLREDTRFWVVRPRISGSGVTGLGTLLSGAYIAMEGPPDSTKPLATQFKGLEEPPIDASGAGLRLVLTSDRLHGLQEGSGIFFRDLLVGAVERYELDKDGTGVSIYVTIDEKHKELVRENTRFWNASGFDITASLQQGLEIDMESIRTLLAGGVTFDTPGQPGKAAENGARFELRKHAHGGGQGGPAPPRGPRFVLQAPTRGSVKPGDPVLYREETVGRVVSHALNDDARSVGILVAIENRYASLVRAKTVFWNASGISADLGFTGVHIHTESLESLIEGGVAFATPEDAGARAASGSVFELKDEAPKNWKKWKPKVSLASHGTAKSAEAEPAEKVHHDDEAQKDPNSHHWFHKLFH